MSPRSFSFLLLGSATTATSSFAQSAWYQQSSEVNNIMVQYEADRGSLNRFYYAESSPDRRERFETLTTDYLKTLNQLKFESLPVGSRVDYILFKRNLEEQQRLLAKEEKEYNQLSNWFTFANTIYTIEKIRRRGMQPDAHKWAGDMKGITAGIDQLSKSLDKETSPDITLIPRAQSIVRGLQAMLKSVNEFYLGYDPGYTWWMPEPYHKLDSSLAAYSKIWQRKERSAPGGKDDGSGIIGYPIGKEELIRQLQLEYIPYTPEELVDIANREFAWCDAEMLKASKDMGFGADWKKALEKVKNSYVPAGKQPEAIMKLYNESVGFLKRSAYFALGIGAFMPNPVYEKIDALLWRPFAQMIIERKNDTRATVHAPEQHANAVFGRLRKIQIP